MSFDLLDEPARLYPLYSDMENSDIENNVTTNNKLTVPSPIQRRRNLRNSSSYISRNYEHYKHMMKQRINRRTNNRFNTNNTHSLSPYSPYTNTNNTHTIYRYNTYINKNNNRINNNPIHTRAPKPQPPTTATTTTITKRRSHSTPKKKVTKQKRRIRTFYSKKWGNKLYGLTKHYPIVTPPTTTTTTNPSPRSLKAFIEEETFDLNDIKSTRSPSPSVPICNHLNIDYRFNNENYDSAISNIAAITHTDNDENDSDIVENNDRNNNNFKIIISSPNNNNNNNNNVNHVQNRRRRRIRRIEYLSSDSSDSSDFSSSDDGDYDNNFNRNMFEKSSLFLANNNMNIGVYSDFNYSDQSETDYLSAQSGDFDELTICYHKDKKNKNIKFRNNYLTDIGPSDIGSSDTEYFSSADSIPDSIPSSIPESIVDDIKQVKKL